MDPSRISLEDDRFGLIGVAFRSQNRTTYAGRDGADHVWSVGIVVGDEDEIQTVEIDDHGAKSSRMLTPGELFEGLEIVAAPGADAHVIVGTFTLLGMDLRATGPETATEFARLLRTAADDRDWRLPLHLIGQPRDLQLSAQGREILRQTAAAIERDGQARTTLPAAQRLELSPQALDSIRRRIARKSLQAYRMHGRWYVVLDNLARSRTVEMNGTSSVSVPPSTMVTEAPPSPFEEVPSDVDRELEQSASTQITVEEPSYVRDDIVVEPESEPVYHGMASPQAVNETAGTAESADPVAIDVDMAQQPEVPSDEDLSAFVAAEPETDAVPVADDAHVAVGSEPADDSTDRIDQLISETILEQFIMTELDVIGSEPGLNEAEESTAGPWEQQPAPRTQDLVAGATVDETSDFDGATQEPHAGPDADFAQSTSPDASREENLTTAAAEPEDSLMDATGGAAATGEVEELPDVDEAESVVAESTRFAPEADPEMTDVATSDTPESMSDESASQETDAPVLDAVAEGEAPEPEAANASVSDAANARQGDAEVDEAEVPFSEEGLASGPLPAKEDEMREEFPASGAEDDLAQSSEPSEDIEVAAAPDMTRVAAEESDSSGTAAAAEAHEPAPGSQFVESGSDMLMHLRDEVAFLRLQSQEKDRQIVAWINGAQWLQPFVDQIHSLEQQVERLGDLQVKRDGDRISDLVSERDALRQRLAALEAEIAASRAAKIAADGNRRSWFRKMMGPG